VSVSLPPASIRPIRLGAQAQASAAVRRDEPRRRHLFGKGRTRKGRVAASMADCRRVRKRRPVATGLPRPSVGAGAHVEKAPGVSRRPRSTSPWSRSRPSLFGPSASYRCATAASFRRATSAPPGRSRCRHDRHRASASSLCRAQALVLLGVRRPLSQYSTH